MYGLGSMMMGGGMGGSARDGAPQMPMGGMMGGMDNQGLGGLLGQILKGNKGGLQMPLFANGPLGQAMGSQGLPMGILALLGRQLGK